MKKIKVYVLAASLIFGVAVFAAVGVEANGPQRNQMARQGDQDFLLVNKTGVEINALFVSPTNTNLWEEDVLGVNTLPAGEELMIYFSREEDDALWDLRVEDEEGNFIVWYKLNLLQISKVTLYYKNGKATAVVE